MPNTLIYPTHDPAKIGTKLEELVRQNLGTPMRVPYEIVDARQPDKAGALKDLGRIMVGADLTATVGSFVFTLPWHRPATLTIGTTRWTINTICFYVLYDIELARDIDGAIGFDKKQFVGEGGGGATIASRLNGAAGLAKRVNDLLRGHQLVGNVMLKQDPLFWVGRDEAGQTRLVIRTIARQRGMLIAKGDTLAGEVMSIAKAVESAV